MPKVWSAKSVLRVQKGRLWQAANVESVVPLRLDGRLACCLCWCVLRSPITSLTRRCLGLARFGTFQRQSGHVRSSFLPSKGLDMSHISKQFRLVGTSLTRSKKPTFKFLVAFGTGAIPSYALQERYHGMYSSRKCLATSCSAWINVSEVGAHGPVQLFKPEIHGVRLGFCKPGLHYWWQSHDQLPVEHSGLSSCASMAVALLFGI